MINENIKRTLNQALCRLCQRQVELKSFRQAAELLKTNFNEIKLLAENLQLHRLHDARGNMTICADSLFSVLQTRPTQRFEADVFKTNPSASNYFIGDIR